MINIRNAVKDHHWTNLRLSFVERFRESMNGGPAVYVMTAWLPSDTGVHVWVIPEEVVYEALPHHPIGKLKEKRTVCIIPGTHKFERCSASPDLAPYYELITWTPAELSRLVEAVKLDEAARKHNQDESSVDDDLATDDDDGAQGEAAPGYTTATVDFVRELAQNTSNGKWHEANKKRFQNVLRSPTQRFVELLRNAYIERLSPVVAGGKQHLSRLKKNDFGKGGYHDYYWFAFYDPSAGSKTNSVQLFFSLLGLEQVWRYGFAMGNDCESYIERLTSAISENISAVAAYFRSAPPSTTVQIRSGDDQRVVTPQQFAGLLESKAVEWLGEENKLTSIDIIQENALETLPSRDERLVEEVGKFLVLPTFPWVA
ncbi:MAG: hypothetical protein U0939_22830 [Pirellulales bacterium]